MDCEEEPTRARPPLHPLGGSDEREESVGDERACRRITGSKIVYLVGVARHTVTRYTAVAVVHWKEFEQEGYL